MANRPIYIPKTNSLGVIEKEVEFKWYPGLSTSQKQKSVKSLHTSAKKQNISPVLEISSKSLTPIGVKLSAFNLELTHNQKAYKVEAVFQSGKVFTDGGPFIDLLTKSPRDIKKDPRLKSSGVLSRFQYFGENFSLEPKTFFYDWIYLNALNQNQDLAVELLDYAGFSDIEFNPKKSINCQARSAALYVSLFKTNQLSDVFKSQRKFHKILLDHYSQMQPNTALGF